MSIPAKKNENILKKAKYNNLLKTKIILNIKMWAKGGQFLHLACQGDGSPPAPPSVTPLMADLLNNAAHMRQVQIWVRRRKIY